MERAGFPGNVFPALGSDVSNRLLALQFQLSRTERLAPDAFAELQAAQLRLVLEHAYRTVPYYRRLFETHGVSLPAKGEVEFIRTLPVSRRAMIQEAGVSLESEAVPAAHGPVARIITSGSTGRAVTLQATGLTQLMWDAFTLREHLWHRRDLRLKLSSIRWAPRHIAPPPDGLRFAGWGRAAEAAGPTGPASLLNVTAPVAQQAEWVVRERPAYLLSFPSNLAALARHCLQEGIGFPGLIEVRTIGETLTADQQNLFRQAWDCKVTDLYSCEEAGCLALQCPDSGQYHVQAENVLLEIVDDAGRPCAAGETGRVLITTLHNFATPLIRYELGDLAEAGSPCSCGRTLPVIRRVRGRTRNRLVFPDGRSAFPYLGEHGGIERATGVKVHAFQFVQRTVMQIDLRLVTARDFTAEETERVVQLVRRNLGYDFDVSITRCAAIAKGPREKFEEFVSEVAAS